MSMSVSLPYIDFHTHRQVHAGESDVLEIVSMHEKTKDDNAWQTIGYHPWWTHSILEPFRLQDISMAISTNKKCIALGECGLDGIKGGSVDVQEKNFELQLELAEKLKVPVIIHCVRRYDRLLQIRRHWKDQLWVVHGYRRNKQLTRQVLDAGIRVSVSPFPDPNESFAEMLRFLPDDAFFIETDSDRRVDIRGRYQLMAELRKIDTFALRKQMYQNCCELFTWNLRPETGLSEQHF